MQTCYINDKCAFFWIVANIFTCNRTNAHGPASPSWCVWTWRMQCLKLWQLLGLLVPWYQSLHEPPGSWRHRCLHHQQQQWQVCPGHSSSSSPPATSAVERVCSTPLHNKHLTPAEKLQLQTNTKVLRIHVDNHFRLLSKDWWSWSIPKWSIN